MADPGAELIVLVGLKYGNSRAVPSMLLDTSEGGISPKGPFWVFTIITIIGGIWAWFTIPETAGLALERMDDLFKLKWYQIGLKGAAAAHAADQVAIEHRLEEKRRTSAIQIEYTGEKGMQGHKWGTKHTELYAWGHVNQWEDADDLLLEGVTAVLPVDHVER